MLGPYEILASIGMDGMGEACGKRGQSATAETLSEVGRILGLTPGDIAVVKHKAELPRLAIKVIQEFGLTLNEIVPRSGVPRSKVSAPKNGATIPVIIHVLRPC